jgi:formylglycine-generating enzyme required for sulfatase activity
VTWFDAVAYCNWLSEQEGIPRDQWCYRPNKDGEYGPGMTMAPQFLQREGYRLPSNAEWEYSCRAGSGTRYCFGESDELLFMYAWYRDNPLMVGSRCHPVASLKPNDFGLFDMHGNITEWCQDDSLASVGANSSAEQDNDMEVTAENSRVTRNGSFHQASSRMRSAHFWDGLASSSGSIGFRLARTLPLVRAPGSLPVPTEGDGTGKTHE